MNLRLPTMVLLAGAAYCFTAPAAARAATELSVVSPVRVHLKGDSNVAPWSCRGDSVIGALHVDGTRAAVLAAAATLSAARPPQSPLPFPTFQMRIPIASLQCGNRRMERDLHRAVKAAEHPEIVFRLTGVRGVPRAAGGGIAVTVSGVVTLAGVEREIEIEVRGERHGADRFRVRAELPLRMTWFGITPPTGMLGLIRARDALEVGLDLTLALPPEQG